MSSIFITLLLIITALITILGLIIAYLAYKGYVEHPKINQSQLNRLTRSESENNYFILGKNKLKLSVYNHWEMYIEGEDYDRGIAIGKLTAELFDNQEKAFKKEIRKYVPNAFYMQVLMVIVAWINRNISLKIPKEYVLEIFGIADSLGLKFFFRNFKYFKILNYHAAHDIGHALANLNLVGCTSFSVKNTKTTDNSLISGRNFDFYFGDDFSKEKIVAFYAPEKGYKFAMITWAGMIGTLSGMNIKGLCVTVNGTKSHLPKKVSTPVSILLREILQYASNIEEAFNIAKKREIIMSEAIMVTSAFDKKTVLIEKSEKNTVIFDSCQDALICTNHLQSDEFFYDKINQENIKGGSTKYRFDRVNELINRNLRFDVSKIALVLRNMDGSHDKKIGLGNEKVINQLIAHHAVIFKPDELKLWVSSQNCTLGEFVCYDLNVVFEKFPLINGNNDISEKEFNIPEDKFVFDGYDNYQIYRKMLNEIQTLNKNIKIDNVELDYFVSLNPEYYQTYIVLSDYFYTRGEYQKAADNLKIGLEKEITFDSDRIRMLRKLKKILCKIR